MANLGLMLVQYLSPMLIFIGITLVSIFYRRLGSVLHGAFVVFAIWFFNAFQNPALFILIAPLIGLGLLYWLGDPQPRRRAAFLVLGLPALTLILAGVEPAWRVSQRIADGNLQARVVVGNGVSLIWAPDGPGWPRTGTDWYEARQVCRYLSEDGLTVASSPQNVWHLPTVDEAVRSMTCHGRNCEGEWDAENAQAIYNLRPDKESPLWNVYSPVIYWWTDTEVDDKYAYIIVYDGKVWPRGKRIRPDYLGFRCVQNSTSAVRQGR